MMDGQGRQMDLLLHTLTMRRSRVAWLNSAQ